MSLVFGRILPILRVSRPHPHVTNINHNTRNIQIFSVLAKKWSASLDPDDEVILLGNKDKQTKMKYSEIMQKAGDRNLVKVQATKKLENAIPIFKIMSDVDLEIAARKARSESNYLGSRTIYETETGRVKQKQLELKSKLSDHDLSIQTSKIVKWLQKGNFVQIEIKTARDSTKEDAVKVQKKIEDVVSELKEFNNSKLKFKIK